MKYKLFKIKSGKKEQWVKWCRTLGGEKKEEAIRTLIEEENIRETIILMGDYVLYAMEGNFKPASDCELNREHRKNLVECLQPIDPRDFTQETGHEILLDLTTPSAQLP